MWHFKTVISLTKKNEKLSERVGCLRIKVRPYLEVLVGAC